MSQLQIRAEIARLARLLGDDGGDFGYLATIDVQALRQLRERATAMLYDADREYLQRIAAATRLVPGAITALIAEKSLGPLLCARIAGLLPVDTAVDIARRLPDDFLADVCIELDPRRARPVVEAIPVPRVVSVSLELARRGEHVTMGRFVDILSLDALAATMQRITDDAALLKVAFYAEDRARLNRVIDQLPPARFGGIIAAAIADDGALWPEALSLIAALEPRWRRAFGELALKQETASVARIIAITDAQQLWPSLLPVVDCIDDAQALHNLHAVLAALDPGLLAAVKALIRPGGGEATFARLAGFAWPEALRPVFAGDAPRRRRARR
ncbi:hypothetical protein [Solimonas soli]|uniref:hypothetical protein n=1 Tax=Solimonas soli TaxID=413479 RepID=UPI0004BA2050|nr:hypothetical protein [Solimonas soli]